MGQCSMWLSKLDNVGNFSQEKNRDLKDRNSNFNNFNSPQPKNPEMPPHLTPPAFNPNYLKHFEFSISQLL